MSRLESRNRIEMSDSKLADECSELRKPSPNLRTPRPDRSRIRVVLIVIAVVVALAGFIRHFFIEGWLLPVRVGGASMAPWLVGEHRAMECIDCGFEMRVGADPPRTDFVRCPNCNSENNVLSQAARRPGERVWIEKWPLLLRDPRRWECLAIEDPDRPEHHVVKRLVGLPGETVRIVDGDLWINGNPVRRSLEVQQQMCWVVHDDRCRQRVGGTAVSRWRPERADSAWRVSPGGFTRQDTQVEEAEDVDWLVYHHVASVTGSLATPRESVVMDDIPINQTARRQLHAVGDLSLAGRCDAHETGELILRQETTAGTQLWSFDFSHSEVSLRSETRLLGSAALRRASFRFRAGFRDGEASLWLDDQVVLTHRFMANERGDAVVSRPFAVGARGLVGEVSELIVTRDTYITADSVGRVERAWRLGAGEFFVLGDNSPVSRDSRHWSRPARPTDFRGVVRRGSPWTPIGKAASR